MKLFSQSFTLSIDRFDTPDEHYFPLSVIDEVIISFATFFLLLW